MPPLSLSLSLSRSLSRALSRSLSLPDGLSPSPWPCASHDVCLLSVPARNWCNNNPCGVHGNCTNLINKFECCCDHGYTGVRCETSKFTYIITVTSLSASSLLLSVIFLSSRPSSIIILLLNCRVLCFQT